MTSLVIDFASAVTCAGRFFRHALTHPSSGQVRKGSSLIDQHVHSYEKVRICHSVPRKIGIEMYCILPERPAVPENNSSDSEIIKVDKLRNSS